MVITTDAKGNLLSPTIPENVYQGSNLANDIIFLTPLGQENTVTITFRLPNGLNTEAYSMSTYTGNTNNLNGWIFYLPSAITEHYGQVVFQIRVIDTMGMIISSVAGSFTVQRGVIPITTQTT